MLTPKELVPDSAQTTSLCAFLVSALGHQGKFTVRPGQDGEIVVNRSLPEKLVTLIIHDDGTVAFSFIAAKHSKETDFLRFCDTPNDIDWTALVYEFFQL